MRGEASAGRFGAAVFTADLVLYLVFTAVPLKAISLGAGPLVLGLLPAVSSTVYVISALAFGRLSDRGGRMRMARLGCLLVASGALLLRIAPGIPWLFVFLPLVSLGGGLFWPAIHAEFGERIEGSGMLRRLGWYNVCWSAGKMTGFWTAGHLTHAFGTDQPLAAAVVLEAALLLFVPRDLASSSSPHAPEVEQAAIAPASTRRRFRIAAWIANGIAFGVGSTLNYQYPSRLFELGLDASDLGNFLGLVGLAQTATFAWLGMRRGWEYRLPVFVLPLAVGAVSVAALAAAQRPLAILLCAPPIGFALGVAFTESFFHSIHREQGRGRNTGVHEALLGVGTFLVPLGGGLLVPAFGGNAPVLLAAVVLAAVAILSLALLHGVSGREGESRRARASS